MFFHWRPWGRTVFIVIVNWITIDKEINYYYYTLTTLQEWKCVDREPTWIWSYLDRWLLFDLSHGGFFSGLSPGLWPWPSRLRSQRRCCCVLLYGWVEYVACESDLLSLYKLFEIINVTTIKWRPLEKKRSLKKNCVKIGTWTVNCVVAIHTCNTQVIVDMLHELQFVYCRYTKLHGCTLLFTSSTR